MSTGTQGNKSAEKAIELLKQLVLRDENTLEIGNPTRDDIVQLLHARKDSMSSVDNLFDSRLLEIGRNAGFEPATPAV